MSPKDFRKISHPEAMILKSFKLSVDTSTHTQTDKCKSRAVPPTVGQLKIFIIAIGRGPQEKWIISVI